MPRLLYMFLLVTATSSAANHAKTLDLKDLVENLFGERIDGPMSKSDENYKPHNPIADETMNKVWNSRHDTGFISEVWNTCLMYAQKKIGLSEASERIVDLFEKLPKWQKEELVENFEAIKQISDFAAAKSETNRTVIHSEGSVTSDEELLLSTKDVDGMPANVHTMCEENLEIDLLDKNKIDLNSVKSAIDYKVDTPDRYTAVSNALVSVLDKIGKIDKGGPAECLATEQLANCLSAIYDALLQSWRFQKRAGYMKKWQSQIDEAKKFTTVDKCDYKSASFLLKRATTKLRHALTNFK